MGTPAPSQRVELVTVSLSELRELIRTEVHDVVAELLEGAAQAPALVTADQLCTALQISRPTLLKLLADDLPHVMCGEHRRYAVAQVVAFLQERRGGGAHGG